MRSELSAEILDAVREESARAHLKRYKDGADGGKSLFDPIGMSVQEKLAALGEEFGEVCRALTYDEFSGRRHLIEELVQLGNTALSWADCESEMLEEDA